MKKMRSPDRHVSERLALLRGGAEDGFGDQDSDRDVDRAEQEHMPMSGSGVPPVEDSRIARMPQVGASAHEIGCAQPGRSVTGTRKPQISQIGYSVIEPSAQAVR